MNERANWPPRALAQPVGDCVWLNREEHSAFSVRGPDRLSWLNGLVTNNVLLVSPERAGWGLVLSKPGKIQSEIWQVETGERLLVFAPEGQAEQLTEQLDRFLIMEDAELAVEPSLSFSLLIGPGALAQATQLKQGLNNSHPEFELAFGELDLLGVGGCILAHPRAAITNLRELIGAGVAARELSLAEWQGLRIEYNLPEFSMDYSTESNPHEAALAHRAPGIGPVDWNKGCYLGQEVVCMQDMRGKVRRRLFPVRLAAAGASEGADVKLDGEVIGQLGRVYSTPLGEVGFALLKTRPLAKHTAEGDSSGEAPKASALRLELGDGSAELLSEYLEPA